MNLQDEIAKAAWELYEKSGFIAGKELENWLEAERIVLARHASQDIEEPEGPEAAEEGEEEAARTGPGRADSQPEAEGATVIEEMDAQAADAEEDIAPAPAGVKTVKKLKKAGKPPAKEKKSTTRGTKTSKR
jgi:Protein of unknown function (DUF2934)